MADKQILHMLTPLKQMSPFDVNMALDAGYDAVATYVGVTLDEVTGLVQDAIFSRPPKRGIKTGVFFGGKNATVALDMMKTAKAALVPPFAISLFADPAGSFTTAAAMVACVEKILKDRKSRELRGLRVAIYGGTGVVGFCSAVITATEGASVKLVGYDGVQRVASAAQEIKSRFGVTITPADGSDQAKQSSILESVEAVFCAGRAGVRILSSAQLRAARDLIIAADVNAVPPTGIEGLEPQANATPFTPHGTLGVGALTIGALKYRIQSALFGQMIAARQPVELDFSDAFALARELNG
jgi:methylene-tetrahydromethanopterin dehydrogenase